MSIENTDGTPIETESEEERPKGGRPRLAKCPRGHTALGVDGKKIPEGGVFPDPCPRCEAGERAVTSHKARTRTTLTPDPTLARIPKIETETDEQKTERADRERIAQESAYLAAQKVRAEAAEQARISADQVRTVLAAFDRGRAAALADAFAEKRGRQRPSTIRCAVMRANPAVQLEFAKPPMPWTTEETDALTALAIGASDALILAAPNMSFLAAPWFPAALTCLSAVLAILGAPKVGVYAPVPAPAPKPAKHDGSATPAAGVVDYLNEQPQPGKITVADMGPDLG